jgi:3-hydroxyacyl-CoA dehydrogenase/enoyl-CoA hydratase/3-hydroxybutyryl-CoA epimerase/enoyl-CoA isomerase
VFEDNEIVDRMMLPLVLEAARCLEEGIVASPAELDMALVLGVGFPAYLGGALKYADWLGLPRVVELSERYAHLGPQYVATPALRAMAQNRQKYY